MRGKAVPVAAVAVAAGITPACAGKSSRNETCWHRPWDHPCVCGEKRFASASLDAYWGSPPRMRGKDALPRPLPQKQGITPAHAGKSVFSENATSVLWDHPRACGEKGWDAALKTLILGSPPRMRGKVTCSSQGADGLRITPAHAGKRPLARAGCAPTWDHPRACGEKAATVAG